MCVGCRILYGRCGANHGQGFIPATPTTLTSPTQTCVDGSLPARCTMAWFEHSFYTLCFLCSVIGSGSPLVAVVASHSLAVSPCGRVWALGTSISRNLSTHHLASCDLPWFLCPCVHPPALCPSCQPTALLAEGLGSPRGRSCRRNEDVVCRCSVGVGLCAEGVFAQFP